MSESEEPDTEIQAKETVEEEGLSEDFFDKGLKS